MRPRCALVLMMAVVGCSSTAKTPAPSPTVSPKSDGYEATIRWTENGVPHIVADTLGSVTFGQGYAFASMHVCVLAEQIVKVKSERAKYFGAGPGDANVNSDFGFLGLGLYKDAAAEWANASADAKAVTAGFVAGYNHYLSKTPKSKLPAACRDAAWLRPLAPVDLIAYSRSISMLASGTAFAPGIGSAEPRSAKSASSRFRVPELEAASNGWAIGSELSANGGGMVVANPHFPWEGPLKFYEVHLTVRGDFDVYGATVLGVPLVSFGFTATHGWTHTFSSSRRFTVYRLNLDEKDPTRYKYGKQTRAMEFDEHTIQIKRPDGLLAVEKRRMYRTHYGPMLDGGMLRWDADTQVGYTMRDAARDNVRSVEQYLAMIRAKDVAAFKAAFRYQSTPFVNTMYAHRDGTVFYIDGSRVPKLSDQAISTWQTMRKLLPPLEAAWRAGLIVLDGSNPIFEWAKDPDAAAPGIVGFAATPKLERKDYVFNANDSYWVANANQRSPAASPFYGYRDAPLSARTRMNLLALHDRGADGKLSAAELEKAFLSDAGFMAHMWRTPVVQRCRAVVARASTPGRAALQNACSVLAEWDGRSSLESRGSLLWRELVSELGGRVMSNDALFATPFDATRPHQTPAGLADAPASGADPIISALGVAIERLTQAGHDPAKARLGELQFTEVSGERIPVSGGLQMEGVLNKVVYSPRRDTLLPLTKRGKLLNRRTGLTRRGYPINNGSSFIMIVRWGDRGPEARGLTTYGASSDPRSPHASDQLQLWKKKQLRPLRFTEAAIKSAPGLRVETVSAAR